MNAFTAIVLTATALQHESGVREMLFFAMHLPLMVAVAGFLGAAEYVRTGNLPWEW